MFASNKRIYRKYIVEQKKELRLTNTLTFIFKMANKGEL